ncbi:uncharacterized protein LOC124918236 [Impatiens glandulifera]|uniref:uncharacterized protein LOC124918236 n=1 Tax=Impatiens glandulifera TaxID=253017 RepID=UPI001FB1796C|nr:uncharacterized protein LOC124918236 [Impatiens glandulifera]
MCMKAPYMFISLIIPGPKSPGKNIDIYLQPLMAELKMLWSEGVRTFDVCRGQQFNLRAMLLWTINDFPSYGMLSGWSTHDHPYRVDTNHFLHGKTVRNQMPSRPTGVELWNAISGMKFAFEDPDGYPLGYGVFHKWTKKSIFWKLPYWGRRTKDNINARKDIFLLCNCLELHIDPQSGMNRMSKVVYTLTRDDNKILCKWLKGLKFPDGYASNLSRCVDRSGCKLIGLKSHDCHVFLERLLPIAFKNFLPNFVWATLTDLSNFMHDLSSTTLSKTSMDNLELATPVILCNLAKIFPPAFFDSMEHLLVHLPYEANVGGLVSSHHKSICNAYILQEITTFASHYFEPDIQCKQRIPQRNIKGPVNLKQPPKSIFNYLGRSSGAKSKRYLDSEELLVAHTYVLLNCPEVEPYYRCVYVDYLKEGLQVASIDREFVTWFRCQILEENELYYVSYGTLTHATSIPIYFVNGYVWRPKDYRSNRSTINSGCVWFDPTRGTRLDNNYRLVEVNLKRKYLRYDPFILEQQAIQVYYSPYPSKTSRQSSWMSVCKTKARGKVEEQWTDDNVVYQQEVHITSIHNELPLNIRSYDVSNLRDPNNIIYMELKGKMRSMILNQKNVTMEQKFPLIRVGVQIQMT